MSREIYVVAATSVGRPREVEIVYVGTDPADADDAYRQAAGQLDRDVAAGAQADPDGWARVFGPGVELQAYPDGGTGESHTTLQRHLSQPDTRRTGGE